jgi:hypothetical protein
VNTPHRLAILALGEHREAHGGLDPIASITDRDALAGVGLDAADKIDEVVVPACH